MMPDQTKSKLDLLAYMVVLGNQFTCLSGGGAGVGEVRGTPFEQEGLNSLLHFSL